MYIYSRKAGFPLVSREQSERFGVAVVALPLSCLLKLSGLWQFDANVYSIKLFQENF